MIDAEDYPFDPSLPMARLAFAQGLNRLRWIPNRAQAQHMADIYESANDPVRRRSAEKFEAEKRDEWRRRLARVAEASQRGDHGDEARELAYKVLTCEPHEATLDALETYLRALQKLNIDVHSMPSRRGGGRRKFNDD